MADEYRKTQLKGGQLIDRCFPPIAVVCGWHSGTSKQRSTAILTTSLSILSPMEEMGRAYNQAPDSLWYIVGQSSAGLLS